MYAQGVPEVAPTRVGIHLSWSGPLSWVYAGGDGRCSGGRPGRLEARIAGASTQPAIAELRVAREAGCASAPDAASGGWLSALDGAGPAAPR